MCSEVSPPKIKHGHLGSFRQDDWATSSNTGVGGSGPAPFLFLLPGGESGTRGPLCQADGVVGRREEMLAPINPHQFYTSAFLWAVIKVIQVGISVCKTFVSIYSQPFACDRELQTCFTNGVGGWSCLVGASSPLPGCFPASSPQAVECTVEGLDLPAPSSSPSTATW